MTFKMLNSSIHNEKFPTHLESAGITFGQSVSAYASGRKNYPCAVFDFLSTRLPKTASILELGCGTGIATKQLYEQGFQSLTATDIDPMMLSAAIIGCPQVKFQTVDGNTLPFRDHIFDSIVAFGCFHWFCNSEAVLEIKRVLNPMGLFFVVNKRDTGLFRENFRNFLERLERKSIVEPKSDYQPINMLINNQFNIEIFTINSKELFTQDELLSYSQSISLWTSLSAENQKNYMPYLIQFIEELMRGQDYYERTIEVQCLIASPM